jgi:TRAP-type C4-dicarboxylate transport system permease small subunit
VTRPTGTAIRLLAAFNAPIARWGRSIAAILLALMLAVAVAQILSRALFNFTLDWAEELARMSLVWSVLLTAPFGYRAGAHVAISAFAESLPPRLLYATALFVNVLIGWICLTLLIESAGLVERGLTIVGSAVPIRMAWVYAIVPVSLTALLLVSLEAVLRLADSLRRGVWDQMLSGVVPVMHSDPTEP